MQYMLDSTIIRLILSQAFLVFYVILLIPLREPIKRSKIIVIVSATVITLMNSLLIIELGLLFYIRFYVLSLTLPYLILLHFIAVSKGAKLLFAFLTIQVVSNFSIINGLLASYMFYGENNPIIDTIFRLITLTLFLPIVYKYIRPTYLKMVKVLNKGWWILNGALILSYAQAYYILFVPDPIFFRPEYFVHAYLGIILSLLIYAIIYFLFIEIQLKTSTEQDKQLLYFEVESLAVQSAEITSIAYVDSLTGIKNRYSLFRNLDQLIEKKQDFILFFIDLNDLKEINDSYNHSKGDVYLKQFATALQKNVKDIGEVYRFAGDEFICIIHGNSILFSLDEFKEEIANDMIIDIKYHGFSLGIAHYPKNGLSSDELINFADQAMYEEKRARKIVR
jgi:diguanylate cyclase (GGDEF)-like protein